MDLLLTVVRFGQDAESGEDVLVSAPEESTVADLARSLDEYLGPANRASGPAADAAENGASAAGASAAGDATGVVVGLRGGGAPGVWRGETLLDSEARLDEGVLRDGAVVGIGGPVVGIGGPVVGGAEPGGVVEVRVIGGEGAGLVRRLGLGEYVVGGDGCDVALPGAERALVRVIVEVDGVVSVEPVGESQELDAPVRPVRAHPLPGPLVLARCGDGDEAGDSGGRWWRRSRRGRGGDVVLPAHEERDPDERRGLVELDRRRLVERAVWEPGTVLSAGASLLAVGSVPVVDAVVSASEDGAGVDFNRPPRLARPGRARSFSLPRRPRESRAQAFSWLVLAAPVVMGVVMFVVTRRVASLLFVLFSPVMMLANRRTGATNRKRAHRRAVADYERAKRAAEGAAFEALVREQGQRRDEQPDPAEVLLRASGPRAGLWERRADDEDWLDMRVGTADVPSRVELGVPERASYEEPLRWAVADVPVSVPLGGLGVVGVAGPRARMTARWMVAQCAGLHSPAELDLMVLADPADAVGAGRRWDWVRWLPHVRTGAGGVRVRAGVDERSVAREVNRILSVIEERAAVRGPGSRPEGRTMVVVLDGARALRLVPGMVQALRQGPQVGIVFICVDHDRVSLPEECRAVVSAQNPLAQVWVAGADPVEQVRLDAPSLEWAERMARCLAPVRDASAQGAQGAIPRASRLLDVMGVDGRPDPRLVAGWWASSGGRSTRVTVGEDAEGAFSIDLRADGPHALVAGTTGSGKSELLQTLIAGLCAANTPEAMTFVLVDYKGGAAFKDCAHLPHTVGMVTDLDGHLTSRALDSLGAELRRRERQLARAGAKDVDDYAATAHAATDPMPRLVLIIDEFAALITELPDFVTGLVDIARRGRSLGVHLVLATQRPAGVVSADIRSNTNLRIALRVTDESDSQDVIEAPDAAHIPPALPGRAYARLGHGRLLAFQASRIGGHRPHTIHQPRPRVHPLHLALLTRPAPAAPTSTQDTNAPTDLADLVTATTTAHHDTHGPTPHQPWLPPLPDAITLTALTTNTTDGEAEATDTDGEAEATDTGGGAEADGEAEAGAHTGGDTGGDTDGEAKAGAHTGGGAGFLPPLIIGLEDIPSEQAQRPMTWDYTRTGHLGIAGAPRTGRTTFLRALATGIATTASPADAHIYGIDAGSGGLLPLISLPHTGAIITRDQSDRLRRLLTKLTTQITTRQQTLAAAGHTSLAEQRAAADPDDRLPYLILLIDRWDGLTTVYETVDGGKILEQIRILLREGAAMGLRAAITGDRTTFRSHMGMLLEDRLIFRMPTPDSFDLVGMRARDVPATMPPGRAFRTGPSHPREVQTPLLDTTPTGTAQTTAFYHHARTATTRWPTPPPHRQPPHIDDLPLTITTPEALALGPTPPPDHLPLGIGGDTLHIHTTTMEDAGNGILITGPRRSGRSTALTFILHTTLAHHTPTILITPRRTPLTDYAHHPAITATLDTTNTADDLTTLLNNNHNTLLIIDDLDTLGKTHPLAKEAETYMRACRDHPGGVIITCNIDEAMGMASGLLASVRKNRTGLILAPRDSSDGQLLGARLPRSIGAPVPPGRAILTTPTGWTWIQIPRTPSPQQNK